MHFPAFYLEISIWLVILLYAASSVFFVLQLNFRGWHFDRLAWYCALLGLTMHAVVIIWRWLLVGHGPYRTIQEILVCDSSFIVLAFLLAVWRTPKLRPLGAFVMPLALIAMGGGLMASHEDAFLSPSLRSPWLVVHVLFAKLTVGSIAAATGLAAVFLLDGSRKGQSSFRNLLPEPEKITEVSLRLLQTSFIFSSLMIIAGAIWANDAWGRYWGWDAVETWSLITWGLYGLILHLRLAWRLPDRGLAILLIFALISSIIAFFLIPYGLESIHSQYFRS